MKPILFSGDMVESILAGKKTQTRRVIKDIHPPYSDVVENYNSDGSADHYHYTMDEYGDYHTNINPYGQRGDCLWVRESFRYGGNGEILYRCDYNEHERKKNGPWKPSIFMPRSASRITLKIMNVRVERLHGISESDALSEGIKKTWVAMHSPMHQDIRYCAPGVVHTNCYGERDCCAPAYITAKAAYMVLWESINGIGSWEQNPWVWVIEFDRVGAATEGRDYAERVKP